MLEWIWQRNRYVPAWPNRREADEPWGSGLWNAQPPPYATRRWSLVTATHLTRVPGAILDVLGAQWGEE
jgi:hypothetical protein